MIKYLHSSINMSNLLLDKAVGEISKTTFLWITYVLMSIISLKWLLSITRKAKTHHKLPPSPFRLPVIGNLHQLGSLPHRKLALLAKRYGPIMLLHLGNKPTLVVSSASYAQEILKTHDICFLNRPNSKAFKKVSYGGSDIAIAPYGDTWRYLRSLLAQQILSPKRVKAFRVLREEETFQMIKKIEEVVVRGDPFNLSEFLYSVPVGLLCKVAFGEHFMVQTGSIHFKELLEELMLLVGAFDVEDFIPWLGWINNFNGINTRQDKLFQKLYLVVENILKDHTDNNKACGGARPEDQMDVVDVLLEIQKKNNLESEKGGVSLSRDNIKGIIMDMFTGGTETISTTMNWAMTALIRHPELMKKVQTEIRDIMQSRQRVTEDDITKMEYLKAVIKETYRFHPTVPLLVPRESLQHVNIHGYDIPSGTRVIINAWAIGRDPYSWDNPEVFAPERFLKGGSASERDFRGMSFELIPFGAGRRGCPGVSYATPVIELVLASLLHKFDWSLPGGIKVEDLDMSESFGLTLVKKYPLNVVATAAATY